MGQGGSAEVKGAAGETCVEEGKMGAWVMEGPVGVESLTVSSSVAIPEPGKGEARIKVMAAGLNYHDVRRAHTELSYPAVVGLDGAGIIDALGQSCDHSLPVGSKVYFTCDSNQPHGTLAEYTIVRSDKLFIMQENVSFTTAASLPTAGWAAYLAVHHKLRVTKGKTIYITGGAGGLGGFAANMCKTAGLTVISSCSSYNTSYAKEMGADYVLDYTSDNIPEEVSTITDGKGVDYILDIVGSESVNQNIQLLAHGGHVCTSNGIVTHSKDLFDKGVSVHYLHLDGLYISPFQAHELKILADTVMHLTSINQLKTNIGEVGKWTDVREALQTLSTRHIRGKLVINVEPLHTKRAEQKALAQSKTYLITDKASLENLLKSAAASNPKVVVSEAVLGFAGKTVKVTETANGLVKCLHASRTCWLPVEAMTQVEDEPAAESSSPVAEAVSPPPESEPSPQQEVQPQVPDVQQQAAVPQELSPMATQPQQVPVEQTPPQPQQVHQVEPQQQPHVQPQKIEQVQQPQQVRAVLPEQQVQHVQQVQPHQPQVQQAQQAQPHQPQVQQQAQQCAPQLPQAGGYYIPPQYLKRVEEQKIEELNRQAHSRF